MNKIYQTRLGFTVPDEHIPSEKDLRRYANNDETVIHILVEGLTGYIVNLVEWFLSKTETAQPFREDCISESLLALHEFTVNHLGQKYKPTHFMCAVRLSCLGKVKVWLREMSVSVTIPRTTQNRTGISPNQQRLNDQMKLLSKNSIFDDVWFSIFMDSLDDFDQQLIQLKIDGKSNREIGRELGLEHHHVQMHLSKLVDILEGN